MPSNKKDVFEIMSVSIKNVDKAFLNVFDRITSVVETASNTLEKIYKNKVLNIMKRTWKLLKLKSDQNTKLETGLAKEGDVFFFDELISNATDYEFEKKKKKNITDDYVSTAYDLADIFFDIAKLMGPIEVKEDDKDGLVLAISNMLNYQNDDFILYMLAVLLKPMYEDINPRLDEAENIPQLFEKNVNNSLDDNDIDTINEFIDMVGLNDIVQLNPLEKKSEKKKEEEAEKKKEEEEKKEEGEGKKGKIREAIKKILDLYLKSSTKKLLKENRDNFINNFTLEGRAPDESLITSFTKKINEIGKKERAPKKWKDSGTFINQILEHTVSGFDTKPASKAIARNIFEETSRFEFFITMVYILAKSAYDGVLYRIKLSFNGNRDFIESFKRITSTKEGQEKVLDYKEILEYLEKLEKEWSK